MSLYTFPDADARQEFSAKLSGLRSLLGDVLLQLADVEADTRHRDWSDVGTLSVAFEDAGSVLGCLQVLSQ